MSMPFNLLWKQNGLVIRGYQNGADVNGPLVFPVGFPTKTSGPLNITLQSSAQANNTLDILSNVKLYLTGNSEDLGIIQGMGQSSTLGWPNLGFAFDPPRSWMNGGLQISFDGINWTTFSSVQSNAPGSVGVGDQTDPTTWLLIPAIAMGVSGTDGTIGPFDIANIYLQYVVPSTANNYEIPIIYLTVDADIV